LTLRSTPDLCDEYPDLIQVLEPILRSYGGRQQFSGQVITVKCFEDNSKVKELVGKPGEGRVLVVDAGGSMRRACLGDMLAAQGAANGWSGIVIFGCIRDVNEIAEIDLGVQALGTHPMKTDKKGVGDIGIPVTFGGITFNTGDYVYADNNGLILATVPLE